MLKTLVLAVSVEFLTTGFAIANPDTVPGVACPACHEGSPPTKVLTSKAAARFSVNKDVKKCKECHSSGGRGNLVPKARYP